MTFEFRSYRSATGRNDVSAEYEGGTDELQAGLDVALNYLVHLPRMKWSNPRTHAARLSKQDWPDFYEIRFFANRTQQRPIGFFGPDENVFTIVMWCTEKGGKIIPTTWFKTAFTRRQEILDGTSTSVFFKDKDCL